VPKELSGAVGVSVLLLPVVPVVPVPMLLPPVAPGVVLLSVPAAPEPLSMLLPPLAPGVVLFSVPALPPIVPLPLSRLLPPVAPGTVLPSVPLPLVPPVPRESLTSQLPVAPLPLQVTPGVVVMVPVVLLLCAKAAPGAHRLARASASMLHLIGCSVRNDRVW
jgi:hypothetical protein